MVSGTQHGAAFPRPEWPGAFSEPERALIMPRWANIICIPCLTVGLGLVLFSATAAAADAQAGPSWSVIATGLIGVVVALVGAYAKGLESRISRNEANIAAGATNVTTLRELLLSRYLDDAEIERLLGPINIQLGDVSRRQRHNEILLVSLHNRLDQARIGVRPNVLPPDDGN